MRPIAADVVTCRGLCVYACWAVAGPMAWNSLPDSVRDPTSITDFFRRLLKTYLFARYYCIQRIRGS